MKKKEILLLLLVLVSVFALFLPSLGNEGINWDNPENIWENPTVHKFDFQHLSRIFSSAPHSLYMPLTFLSFAFEYYFVGEDPFLYHLDSLWLHCAVVALVYVFLRRLGLDAGSVLLAAFLFGIHPLHVEAVVWISSRKDLLYAFFYLLASIMYLKYLDTGRARDYSMALLAGLASILSKPMAASLPLILFWLDWYRGRKWARKLIIEKIPFLVLMLPIAAISVGLHQDYPLRLSGHSFLIWCWTFGFYIYQFLFPFHPHPLYQVPKPVGLYGHPVYPIAFASFLLCVFLLARFRKKRIFVFACGYYFLSIFFLLRFTEKVKYTTTFVADRYMYLPSLGFFVLLALAIMFLIRKARAHSRFFYGLGITLVALMMAIWAITSYAYTSTWRNSIVFWTRVIERNPTVANAYLNRGEAFFERGHYRKARADFSRTIALWPMDAKAYASRGACDVLLGDPQSALRDFDQAIALDPDYAMAYHNRSLLWAQMQKYTLALVDAQRAARLGYAVRPDYLRFLSQR